LWHSSTNRIPPPGVEQGVVVLRRPVHHHQALLGLGGHEPHERRLPTARAGQQKYMRNRHASGDRRLHTDLQLELRLVLADVVVPRRRGERTLAGHHGRELGLGGHVVGLTDLVGDGGAGAADEHGELVGVEGLHRFFLLR